MSRLAGAGSPYVLVAHAIFMLALAGATSLHASAALAAAPPLKGRIERIERGLLPPVLIKGESGQEKNIAERMNALKVPGASVTVVDDGKIAWTRGFGVSRVGGPPVTPETLFQAASISKTVSALAVLQLAQAGRVDLDTDVNIYLKTWKIPSNELTATQKVTLRRLLSHSAGTTVHGFRGYAAGEPLPTLVQILDGLAPANNAPIRVDVLPGEKWRYSGGGYTIVQQMVQDVTGTPFAELMRDRVLQPLGMRHSTFQQPLTAKLLLNAAYPYLASGRAVEGGPYVYPELAAAGLWTTSSDLARYAIGVQRAWTGRSSSVLSQSSARAMLTRTSNQHGLGPVVAGSMEHPYFMHGGANTGFRCMLVSYADGDGVVVMTNGDNGLDLAWEIIRAVAREYRWPDFVPPERAIVAIEPRRFDRYEGVYRLDAGDAVTLWRDGEHLYSRVGGTAIAELFPMGEGEYFQKISETRFVLASAADAAMTVTVHENGVERVARRVNNEESRVLLPQARAVSRRFQEQTPAPQSEQALRALIAALANGTPDYRAMTPAMAQMTRMNLPLVRKELGSFGVVRSVTFREVASTGADIYRVDFERATVEFRIGVEPDGRVGAVYYSQE